MDTERGRLACSDAGRVESFFQFIDRLENTSCKKGRITLSDGGMNDHAYASLIQFY